MSKDGDDVQFLSGTEEAYRPNRSIRKRTKTNRFEFDELDNEEQRLIQQAIVNSKKEVKRVVLDIPEAPTYRPTVEEFKDPLGYINKIRPEAEFYGICRIVPPPQWNPKCLVDPMSPKRFETKRQEINRLQEGLGFDEGDTYDFQSYKRMADSFYRDWVNAHYKSMEYSPTIDDLTRDYWSIVETGQREVTVDYANDIDTVKYMSGFPYQNGKHTSGVESPDCADMFSDDYYARTGWNLNNIPLCDGSVLKHLRTPINGVNVPWLYIGMLFTSFCWHNEDNYLYSINYSHFGAVKQWYGVPGSAASIFEKTSKAIVFESFQDSPDLLHHMTTQISPSLLMSRGVPVYKSQQDAGTFIITFPKAFHCGFSTGFNCGEAVNFATPDWLSSGGESEERYRTFARPSVFSHHRLLFTVHRHKHEIQMEAARRVLEKEVFKVLKDELQSRRNVLLSGIKDISERVKLPPNVFTTIDRKAADYDDMRTCFYCKHICVFSAVACECDAVKVSCVRHYTRMCSCPKEKKYLLCWTDTKDMEALYNILEAEEAKRKGVKRPLEGPPQDKVDLTQSHSVHPTISITASNPNPTSAPNPNPTSAPNPNPNPNPATILKISGMASQLQKPPASQL